MIHLFPKPLKLDTPNSAYCLQRQKQPIVCARGEVIGLDKFNASVLLLSHACTPVRKTSRASTHTFSFCLIYFFALNSVSVSFQMRFSYLTFVFNSLKLFVIILVFIGLNLFNYYYMEGVSQWQYLGKCVQVL